MTRNIRLLYFKNCPNVDAARSSLRAALAQAGLPVHWIETDIEAPDCPPDLRTFPSPTVLVEGRDVSGGGQAPEGTGACRLGGAPSAEAISRVLNDHSWLGSVAALPAALIGLLPATFCPFCIPALGGLLGALGLGAFAGRILAPLTLALLAVALGGLAFQSRRRGDYRPLIAGAAGAAALFAGQFFLESALLKGLGISVLVGSSLWNIMPRRQTAGGGPCSACAKGGE
ncbi:MAG: hypothetical protein HYV14_01610 [Elusimicrobia bacterium]|nr:hypothetical protein [Elusimicrobiota bacterium]